MAQITLKVNGKSRVVDTDPTTPLLYVLRDDLELNGPRFGCGLSQCGACTVILDGAAVRSCSLPVSAVRSQRDHHPRRLGQRRASASAAGRVHRGAGRAVRLLHERHDHECQSPARQESPSHRRRHPQALDPNLCRCGSHLRVIRAVKRASASV